MYVFCCLVVQLVNVDAIAGLDLLVEQGEWEQCVELAKDKVCENVV